MSSLVALSVQAKSIREESANQLTHAVGLILSVIGTVALLNVAYANDNGSQILGCEIYCVTLVALYAASTLSHSFQEPRLRHFFRTLDQICIFFLIAGSFTPLAMTHFLDSGWCSLLVAMWSLAFVGSFFKVFVKGHQNVALWAYVLLGWLPIIAIKPMADHVTNLGLLWFIAGGLFYSIGTLFLVLDDRVRYFHAVWHILVVAGSASHFIGTLFFVVIVPQ